MGKHKDLEEFDREKIELGEFKKRHDAKGQRILEFQNYYFFLLRNEKFHLASEYLEMPCQGIGLNPHVLRIAPLDKLIIEDGKESCFYILDDLEYVKQNYGIYTIKGTKLLVLPVEGLKKVKVDKENIPYELIFS